MKARAMKKKKKHGGGGRGLMNQRDVEIDEAPPPVQYILLTNNNVYVQPIRQCSIKTKQKHTYENQ